MKQLVLCFGFLYTGAAMETTSHRSLAAYTVLAALMFGVSIAAGGKERLQKH